MVARQLNQMAMVLLLNRMKMVARQLNQMVTVLPLSRTKMVVAQLNRMATGLLSNPTSMKLAPRGAGQLIHQVQTKRAPTTMALQ